MDKFIDEWYRMGSQTATRPSYEVLASLVEQSFEGRPIPKIDGQELPQLLREGRLYPISMSEMKTDNSTSPASNVFTITFDKIK